jgi:hypothetical protein
MGAMVLVALLLLLICTWEPEGENSIWLSA